MDFPGSFGDHILPDQMHAINLSFIVNKFQRRRGGTAGNVSYSMGLLKSPHKLFSTAGKDFPEYKKPFKRLGIDTKGVKVYKNEYTATGFAMTDRDNNQIWGFFYGAAEKVIDLDIADVAKKGDLVLAGPSGAVGTMHIIRQCVKLGIEYMFDPGFILTQVSNEDLLYGVTHAAYIIGNDYEIKIIKERVKNWQILFKKKIVITTLGEEGAFLQTPEKGYHVAIAPAKRVIDPTGAGDAWRSGFLAGLERGFDVLTCGRMGSVASSFAIEEYGTQEHKYTKKEFEKRYRHAYNDVIML